MKTLTIDNLFFVGKWHRIGDVIFMAGLIKKSAFIESAVRAKYTELFKGEVEDFQLITFENKFPCWGSFLLPKTCPISNDLNCGRQIVSPISYSCLQ